MKIPTIPDEGTDIAPSDPMELNLRQNRGESSVDIKTLNPRYNGGRSYHYHSGYSGGDCKKPYAKCKPFIKITVKYMPARSFKRRFARAIRQVARNHAAAVKAIKQAQAARAHAETAKAKAEKHLGGDDG